MSLSLQEAVSAFGRATKSKLSNPVASGAPEDQLRAPLDALIPHLAELAGLHPGTVVMVGETSLADIKTRPDYAVTRGGALSGFIEIKAPGKGADPRRFRDPHDQEQWTKLQSLPNLIYTDGNGFSLWRNGSLEGDVVRLEGDVETAGAKLAAPDRLLSLFANFFQWEPQPPRSAQELAGTTARLCRLLREEVTEQLGRRSPSLTPPRGRLAQMSVPERYGRSLRGRLCAGRDVRASHGPGARHHPRRWSRPRCKGTLPHEHPDRHRSSSPHRQRRPRDGAKDIARDTHPRA